VSTVVVPRKGKPSKTRRDLEHSPSFRRLIKWRTGSKGRISHLKHRYGWNRTLFDGHPGARTWCGLGVLTHNTTKIATLIEDKTRRRAEHAPAPPAPGDSPPPPLDHAA
jgi:IS5 family transposase